MKESLACGGLCMKWSFSAFFKKKFWEPNKSIWKRTKTTISCIYHHLSKALSQTLCTKNHPYGTYKNFQTERFFKLHFQPNPNQTPERTKAHRIGPMYWEYFYFRDLSYMCHMIWNIFSKKLTKNIGNVTWKRDNMTFNLEIQLSTSNTII